MKPNAVINEIGKYPVGIKFIPLHKGILFVSCDENGQAHIYSPFYYRELAPKPLIKPKWWQFWKKYDASKIEYQPEYWDMLVYVKNIALYPESGYVVDAIRHKILWSKDRPRWHKYSKAGAKSALLNYLKNNEQVMCVFEDRPYFLIADGNKQGN